MYQKSKRECLEKDIEKLQNMTAVEYLENLNPEIKEQLIGLCLNIKFLKIWMMIRIITRKILKKSKNKLFELEYLNNYIKVNILNLN